MGDKISIILPDDLKEEISDVISWIMALVNKINFIFRSTYPHFQCNKDPSTLYKSMTLSMLLFERYFDQRENDFICPYCKENQCDPDCRKKVLVTENNIRIEKKQKIRGVVDRALGLDRRQFKRINLLIRAKIGGEEALIVNTGKIEGVETLIVDRGVKGIAFYSNDKFKLNDKSLSKM